MKRLVILISVFVAFAFELLAQNTVKLNIRKVNRINDTLFIDTTSRTQILSVPKVRALKYIALFNRNQINVFEMEMKFVNEPPATLIYGSTKLSPDIRVAFNQLKTLDWFKIKSINGDTNWSVLYKIDRKPTVSRKNRK